MSALALLLASLLPSLAPQDPVPAPAPPEAAPDEVASEKFLRRLLYLWNGSVVRGPARSMGAGAGWEIKLDGQVVSLPEQAVTRTVLEREILEEAATRERAIDAKSAAEIAGHARWQLEQGLYQEGAKDLDRALRVDPDDAAARALVAERIALFPWAAKDLPEPGRTLAAPELEVVLRQPMLQIAHGMADSRLAREAFVFELGQRNLGEPLRVALQDYLQSKSARDRALAAFALRRLFPREAATALVSRSVLDGSEKVRHEAALALRDCGESVVAAPVVKCLASKSPMVQKNAAAALGEMAYPEAVPAMVAALAAAAAQGGGASGSSLGHGYFFHGKQLAYVQDYDVEVATLASIADPVINVLQEGEVLDVRVMSINQELVVSYRAELRKSLEKITGVDPGSSAKAWESWWEKDGPAWYAQATGKSAAATAATTSGGS